MSRTVVLHYHLFKNAGTSVDHLLQSSFKGKWRSREFPAEGQNNTARVEQWISETPEAVAFSSHTMLGPVPQIEGVDIISLVLLRDPIDRIVSAYRFERDQQADTWGAELAKREDFEGYVRARLSRRGDKQCRNFQTNRLVLMRPDVAGFMERAKAALDTVTVAGLVEEFDAAMGDLSSACAARGLTFDARSVHRNVGGPVDPIQISADLSQDLEEANKGDRALIAHLRARRRTLAASAAP